MKAPDGFSTEYFVVGLGRIARGEALRLIYRWTHRDFKARDNGEARILVLRHGGTHSVPLTQLTDAEVQDKLPYAIKKDVARRLAARCVCVRAVSPSRLEQRRATAATCTPLSGRLASGWRPLSDRIRPDSTGFDRSRPASTRIDTCRPISTHIDLYNTNTVRRTRLGACEHCSL